MRQMKVSEPNDLVLRKIGVAGAGNMGIQIACHLAETGFRVLLKTRSCNSTDHIIKKIDENQKKRGGITNFSDRILICMDYDDLRPCDIVIETVVEDLSIKRDVLRNIELNVGPHCVIATNTSGLSINELASSLIEPRRFVGFHCFNPISKMKLIEVVRSKYSSDACVSSVIEFSKAIGKEPIICEDGPGFIVNRLLMPQLNDAMIMVNDGLDPRAIDAAIKLGLNHPMGPLELADLIGLDICHRTLSSLYLQTGDPRFFPCDLLTKMVDEGKLGRKTKHGFYDYGDKI